MTSLMHVTFYATVFSFLHLIIDILLTTFVTFFSTLRRVHSKENIYERITWWRSAFAWCRYLFNQCTFSDIDDSISWVYASFSASHSALLVSWFTWWCWLRSRSYSRSQSSRLLSDNRTHLMKNVSLISLQCHLNQSIFRSQRFLLWSLFSLFMCESFWESVRWLRRWQLYLHSFCLNDKKIFWKEIVRLFCCYFSLLLSISSIQRQRDSFRKRTFVFLSLF
jgi:hypothetical protein